LVFKVHWRKTHASDIDRISFRRRPESRLLSKCRRRSSRCSGNEPGCNDRINSPAGAILRASDTARCHQVLPAIRRGAPRLPPFLSLVVVKLVKPRPRGYARPGAPEVQPNYYAPGVIKSAISDIRMRQRRRRSGESRVSETGAFAAPFCSQATCAFMAAAVGFPSYSGRQGMPSLFLRHLERHIEGLFRCSVYQQPASAEQAHSRFG
jgi:hypothetical protein